MINCNRLICSSLELNRLEKILAGLKEKLETAYKASGGRKVTLITHSMGGLLVRCFLALYRDVCADQPIFPFL
jgi:triacylglycerol esterase/lipase EstA (alpha/beta hydrolase family)